MSKLTKEIHYGNGVKLVYNERLRVWESRREPRAKQQVDNTPKIVDPTPVIHRIPATLTLKPINNNCLRVNNVGYSVDKKNDDSDSDIEVVFESPKATLRPATNQQPVQQQQQPQPFQNVSANSTLKQIANNLQPLKKFVNDEYEVEVIRKSNRVITNGTLAQRAYSRPTVPAVVKPVVQNSFQTVSQWQQMLKYGNITLTKQNNLFENDIVPTQSIPVKPRPVLVKPAIQNNIQNYQNLTNFTNQTMKQLPSNITIIPTTRPVNNQGTIKTYQAPQYPQIEIRMPPEPKKPPVRYEKCTETSLVCLVCKNVFLNPGDNELESRLYGRFCCRKCNQFLLECCDDKVDVDSFECRNDGNCDIGGDERCRYCWFDQAFIALNVEESQRLTSKESNGDERKRKYVYESDSSYNGKSSEVGCHCKFCGKYISSDYNMRVHWVHMHTEAIKDIQLPPSLEKIRQQKYGNRRFKKAVSDDEFETL